ncbi:MAG: undecaprenyl-diphosphate phosphatase [Nevskiales bacterium]
MDLLHAVLLGILQGLTEFLPISSSGHLVLAPIILGWKDQSLVFDVAVHFGTFVAVAAYFRRDLVPIIGAGFSSLRTGDVSSTNARLAWGLVIATIPASALGLLMQTVLELEIDAPTMVAGNLIIFGLVMWWADRFLRGSRGIEDVQWGDFFLIGCAQALALFPGTSRSGITMTAAMALGLSRTAAARLSFLMALPVILIATIYELFVLFNSPEPAPWAALAVGALAAFITGLACIHFLISLLERIGFLPFVIYRLILGGVILLVFV